MAITFPLNLPNETSIKSVTFRARSNIAVTQSPFTYKQQVMRFQGTAWEADISLKAMKREDAEQWIAWFLSLEGQFGTFLMGDPNGKTPMGSAASTPGTPVVNGADQTGQTLNINGCPTSASSYLKPGDYIQLGSGSTSKLYKVLNDVTTNGSGEASLELYPRITVAPSNDATVVVSNCKGLFRLSNNEANWDIQTNLFYGLTFGAVEAI